MIMSKKPTWGDNSDTHTIAQDNLILQRHFFIGKQYLVFGIWYLGTGQANYQEFNKKFEKDGLFWVYIAIFMLKNRIIARLRFERFKCTFTGMNAAAFCHGSHGVFDMFDKRFAANGNTFRPSAFPFDNLTLILNGWLCPSPKDILKMSNLYFSLSRPAN